jgi:hypothetical protein
MLALISTSFSSAQEALDGVILEQSRTDLLKSFRTLGTSKLKNELLNEIK